MIVKIQKSLSWPVRYLYYNQDGTYFKELDVDDVTKRVRKWMKHEYRIFVNAYVDKRGTLHITELADDQNQDW